MLKSFLQKMAAMTFFVTFLTQIVGCDTNSGNEKIKPASGLKFDDDFARSQKPTNLTSCDDKKIFNLYAWVDRFKAASAQNTMARIHLTNLGLRLNGATSHKEPNRLLQQRLLNEQLNLIEALPAEVYANQMLLQVLEPTGCESISFLSTKNDNRVVGFDVDHKKSTATELVLSTPKGGTRSYKKLSDNSLLIRTEEAEQRFDCEKTQSVAQERTYFLTFGSTLPNESAMSAELLELINSSLEENFVVSDDPASPIEVSELFRIQQMLKEQADLLIEKANDETQLTIFKMKPCPAP